MPNLGLPRDLIGAVPTCGGHIVMCFIGSRAVSFIGNDHALFLAILEKLK